MSARPLAPQSTIDLATRAGPVLILVVIVLVFGLLTPSFLAAESLSNTAKQASFIGIAAVGMVFVLLTAGIDLSVGSVMYLAPLVAGLLMRDAGLGVAAALGVCVLTGAALGALNALFIVGLRVVPFVATLATLFLFRGFGAWLTQSRQLDFPDAIRGFGLASVLGVPVPILVFAAVAVAAHVVLRHTAFGRHIYAFGNDPAAAVKAGLPVRRVQAAVYVISGTLAALAGFVVISQIGRLDAGFGRGREFDVIAAAVLGGASLFGGIGGAGSAVIGALTIQAVKAGLVFAGINLYLQPLIQGAVILFAVFFDGLREARLRALRRRVIRPRGV
ncbi:ABC transporter permease [Rubellimicrobium sp. CFH 75288]|uniref:ABC transporter permease n=1 Tax=Rubellimicrobium sp. CFH 75288 TaxID=2697034 RepID=UPI001411B9F8|nr:ABC transporter permease [Rubellimicrobium sp. CFH 75288]NAZ35756.1 ABC transporter permease [Rubellimicrobium sp. CFH 75288]